MANELFEKRSINYSDRGESVMSGELYVLMIIFFPHSLKSFLKHGLEFQFWPYAIRWVIYVEPFQETNYTL